MKVYNSIRENAEMMNHNDESYKLLRFLTVERFIPYANTIIQP